MEFSRIILKPLQTEKTHVLQAYQSKKYSFIVDPKSTKNDILIAFQAIYGLTPIKISTQIRKAAKIRTGTLKPGYSKLTKIAVVTLAKGADIVANVEQVKEKSDNKKRVENKEVIKKEVTKKEVE